MLRRERMNIAEVAERVGYSSASTFSVAFSRHVGLPPSHHARAYEEIDRRNALTGTHAYRDRAQIRSSVLGAAVVEDGT